MVVGRVLGPGLLEFGVGEGAESYAFRGTRAGLLWLVELGYQPWLLLEVVPVHVAATQADTDSRPPRVLCRTGQACSQLVNAGILVDAVHEDDEIGVPDLQVVVEEVFDLCWFELTFRLCRQLIRDHLPESQPALHMGGAAQQQGGHARRSFPGFL